MTLREEIMTALETITDPCSIAAGAPVGLVGMGLVRGLDLREGEEGLDVEVTLTLTSPGCLMGTVFAREIETRLNALPGVSQVVVTFDHESIWRPEDWSRDYRERRAAHLQKLGRQLAAASRQDIRQGHLG